MKNVLEIIFLKLFVWFFNESWNILADISRNSTTARVLIKSTLKKRIPNTYEMSVKISQNSAKLNNSKTTYQTIECELLFLTLKFLKVGSCCTLWSGFTISQKIGFFVHFLKNKCRHSCNMTTESESNWPSS